LILFYCSFPNSYALLCGCLPPSYFLRDSGSQPLSSFFQCSFPLTNPLTLRPSDHFDEKVEASLRRDLPIITTPHAKTHLAESKSPEEAFTAVHDLDFFQDMFVDIKSSGGGEGKRPALKVTGMPGKHVPPGVLGTLNDLINAVCIFFFAVFSGV